MTMHKKKALIFIDLDLTVRHFINSGAFSDIENTYDVTYVFHEDSTSEKKKHIYTNLDELSLKRVLVLDLPRSRAGKWDYLHIPALHRRTRGTPQHAPMNEILRHTHTPKLRAAFRFLSLPGIYELYRWLFVWNWKTYAPILEIIDSEKPDVLIHPTIFQGMFVNDLILASQKMDVPLICLMNSWDNPSQKILVAGNPSKIVVWGEQGAKHAREIMKLPSDTIKICGAAQFSAYQSLREVDNTALRDEFSVPPDVPIVLYAGCSKGVWEGEHLRLLDAGIEEGRIPACHVIYRPHPWRGSLLPGEKTIKDMGLRHVSLDPSMAEYYRSITSGPVPGFQLADYNVTARLFSLVDAVISPLSTMILESALHGTPVMTVFTEEDDEKARGATIGGMRKFVHFAEFFGVPGVRECWSSNTLPEDCAALLHDAKNPSIREHLKQHSKYFVSQTKEPYAHRILNVVNNVVGHVPDSPL